MDHLGCQLPELMNNGVSCQGNSGEEAGLAIGDDGVGC